MYLGEYVVKVDNKGRFIVPSDFRKNNSNSFVVSYIDSNTLIFMNAKNWRPSKLFQKTNINQEKLNLYLMYTKRNSYVVSCDVQGRVMIPKVLRDKLDLCKEYVISGNITHFSFVNKEVYYKEQEVIENEFNSYLESEDGINFRKKLVYKNL